MKKNIVIGIVAVGLVVVGVGWYYLIKLPNDIRAQVDAYFSNFPSEVTRSYEISEINILKRFVKLVDVALANSNTGYNVKFAEITITSSFRRNSDSQKENVHDVSAKNISVEGPETTRYIAENLNLVGLKKSGTTTSAL